MYLVVAVMMGAQLGLCSVGNRMEVRDEREKRAPAVPAPFSLDFFTNRLQIVELFIVDCMCSMVVVSFSLLSSASIYKKSSKGNTFY